MTNQQQVREIYLKVIDATIESVRNELVDKATPEAALDSLNILKARWAARLTQTHDFTDDPALVDKTSASARAAKKSAKKKGPAAAASASGAASASAGAAAARNGVLPVAALTNDEPAAADLPAVPRVPAALRKAEDVELASDSKGDQPPTKRARVSGPGDGGGAADTAPTATTTARRAADDDDGIIENVGEDLDSEDSDVQGEDSDEEAENLVLAQHDKVRKGNKWKVSLREGIVCIRGREYLFNKATCDLDF